MSPSKGAPRGGAAGEPALLGASQVLWAGAGGTTSLTLVLFPLSEEVELPGGVAPWRGRGSVEGPGEGAGLRESASFT